MNNNGLKNLYKINTYAYTEGLYYKARCDDQLLNDYSEDILFTSACLGSASSQLILRGEYKAAERMIDHHAAMFKDRFFIELQAHRDDEQRKVNEALLLMAAKKDLPIILTSDAHYTHQHDKNLHELTLRMATEGSGDGFSFGDIEVYLGSHDDMWSKAKACNIPYEAISNTVHIANMIDHDSYFMDRTNKYPVYKSLPKDITSWQYLEGLAIAGLHKRIPSPIPDKYYDRIREEMYTFKRMGICDYMLIVAEYCNKARELGLIVGPGRGSSAASIVAYCIGITQIDPLKYDLSFARFCNPARDGIPVIF